MNVAVDLNAKYPGLDLTPVDIENLSVDLTGRRIWSFTSLTVRPLARDVSEVLLSKWKMLDQKDVVFLGAGLGLEALVTAKCHPTARVLITDADAKLIELQQQV